MGMATKTERFEVKLAPDEKRTLKRGAKILKKSMARLLLDAGMAAASEAIAGKA